MVFKNEKLEGIKNAIFKTDSSLILYTLSAFLNKGISFLIWPYFTYVLTSEDLGILNNYVAFITFLYPWVSMGVLNILTLEFYKKDRNDIVNLIFNCIIFTGILCVILFLIFYYLNQYSTKFYEVDTYYFLFIPFILLLNVMTDIITFIYRLEEKSKMFLLISTIKIIIELAVSLFLIESFNFSYNARIYSILISYFIPAGLFLSWIYQQDKSAFYFNIYRIKQNIKYGIYGIFIFIGIFCITSCDRFVVTEYLGIEENGFYSIASTIASIFLAFVTALMNYYTPKLYKDFSKKVSFNIIKLNFKNYLLYNFSMYIAIVFVGIFMFNFVINSIYMRSIYSFLILLTSYFAWGLFYYFYNILFYIKEFKLIGLIFVIGILVMYSLIFANKSILSIETIPLFQFMAISTISILSYFIIKNKIVTS